MQLVPPSALLLVLLVMASGQSERSESTSAGPPQRFENSGKVKEVTDRSNGSSVAATVDVGAIAVEKKRRRKGRKGGRKRRPSYSRSWEGRLRELSSQRAADRRCQRWSPDLKVEVNSTAHAIQVDYCTDGASLQTRTCIEETTESWVSSSPTRQCHFLDQGNCTTLFHSLKTGTNYTLTIQPHCRCQDRTVDPCTVPITLRGPYLIPDLDPPELPVSLEGSFPSTKEIAIAFSVLAIGLIIAGVGTVFLGRRFCCRSKGSSSDTSPQQHEHVPLQHLGDGQSPEPDEAGPSPSLGPLHPGTTSGPPDYDKVVKQKGAISQTTVKTPCDDCDAEALYKEPLWSPLSPCNSCVTLDPCECPLLVGRPRPGGLHVPEKPQPSVVLGSPRHDTAGAGEVSHASRPEATGPIELSRHREATSAAGACRTALPDASSPKLKERLFQGVEGEQWGNIRLENEGMDMARVPHATHATGIVQGMQLGIHYPQGTRPMVEDTCIPRPHDGVSDGPHRIPIPRHVRIAPNRDNMIEIPMDLLDIDAVT